MSLESSLGDIVRLDDLSWQVYESLTTAPDVFGTLSTDISNMRAMIQLVKESLEQQGMPQSFDCGGQGTVLACETLLSDAQNLIEKQTNLSTMASQRAIGTAGLAIEDVADLCNRVISATSLLRGFYTTLYGLATSLSATVDPADKPEYRRSHAKIIETLEGLRRDIRAGNLEGSVLSNLDIGDVQNDRQDIWREVMIELEDAGLDPEVIHDERSLITRWIEEIVSNGGFDEDLVADSSSERTVSIIQSAHSNRRLSWTSVDSLSPLVVRALDRDTQIARNFSIDRSPYARTHESSSVVIARPPLKQKSVGRVLDNNDIRVELAKLNDLVFATATMRPSKSAHTLSTMLDGEPEAGDATVDSIVQEDLRNAVTHESHIRNQKYKYERQILPLPWGWVFDGSLGLYRNNVTSDTANNLPLLDLWSFAVMAYELVPRCIRFIRHDFKILNNIPQQPKGSVEASVIEEASWAIEILVRAISKFGILLETSHSPDHIYTEILLLKEFGGNDELLQSVSKLDFISAQTVYSVLMQQILSSLHAFSLIFDSKTSDMNSSSGRDHITSSWQQRLMVNRMSRLKQLLDDEDFWRPVDLGLRYIWSQYSDNSLQYMNKSAKIALIWSQFFKTKQGAAGDKITIRIYSAVSTVGEQLQKSFLSLDRIGSIITQPLVPLDTVCYIVRVLVDGVLLFQTREDERFSPLSRFSWNTARNILATNCQYIDFEIWNVNCIRGHKRRNTAQAVGRIPFKSPISDVAQLGGEDLNKDVHTITEVQMISAQSGRLWGILKVGFSWEGRSTVATNLIAANGFSIETSKSEFLGCAFAYKDYTKITRKVGIIQS